jgi:hypothetical protein
MGLLLFRKALIHGLLNDEFWAITTKFVTVMLMATPHQ